MCVFNDGFTLIDKCICFLELALSIWKVIVVQVCSLGFWNTKADSCPFILLTAAVVSLLLTTFGFTF